MSEEQDKQKEIDVTAELTCLLNGTFIGAGAVLALGGKDEDLEAQAISYFKSYVKSLVEQGLSRNALGFLWSQMGVAARANPNNLVQTVAHYLLGCVLEKDTVEERLDEDGQREGDHPEVENSTVVKQS